MLPLSPITDLAQVGTAFSAQLDRLQKARAKAASEVAARVRISLVAMRPGAAAPAGAVPAATAACHHAFLRAHRAHCRLAATLLPPLPVVVADASTAAGAATALQQQQQAHVAPFSRHALAALWEELKLAMAAAVQLQGAAQVLVKAVRRATY